MRFPVDNDAPGVYLYHEDGTETYYPTRKWVGVSYLFFCPKSGRVWAKAVSGDWTKPFQASSQPINPQHSYWVPNYSIYISYDREFTLALSHDLLIREFDLATQEPNFL
jgi:hypothetical protein